MQDKPTLSISILTSNRADSIRRCLDSLRPIQDKLPCELILVNTATDPAIAQILKEYTDHIIPFVWCNDFSKARNVGLLEASGEWFLYLDDDEWFVDTDELIDFFLSGDYQSYGYANYIQRNFFDPDYIHYNDSWVSRMIRREENTRFRSRIHEYLSPAYGPGKNIHAIVNHSGYIYVTEADRRKRFERNSVLLKEMITEEPDNVRWKIQLAQEYYAVEAWENLQLFCEDCLRNPAIGYIETFYAGLVNSLLGQKRTDEAMQVADRALADNNCSPLGKAYIHLAYGEICYAQGKWKEAEGWITQYLGSKDHLMGDEAQYTRWQEALIVDDTYDAIPLKKAYQILLACEYELGHDADINFFLEKFGWEKSAIYIYPPVVSTFLKMLLKMKKNVFTNRLWKCAYRNAKLEALLFDEAKRTGKEHAFIRKCRDFLCVYFKEQVILEYPEILPEYMQKAAAPMKEGEQGCQKCN